MNQNHYQRRSEHYRTERNRAWSRGFAVGFVTACIIVAAFMYGQREAYGATREAPRVMSNPKANIDTKAWPPNWRTWLRIGMCEQPKRGISWHDVDTDAERFASIAWHQTYNHSFVGGLGFTAQNWRDFRPRSARHIDRMSDATPAQQLWAAERLWRWAEREFPTNGHSAWRCSYVIGWTTADPKDAIQ